MNFPWIILILPFAIASPTSDGESIGLPPMVEPKRTSLEDLLQTFNIHDLESLTPCQQKDSSCPIDKEALLDLVEDIYQVNAYVPEDIDRNDEETDAQTTPSIACTASSGIDTLKLKLKNHLTSGSLIYLVMQIHGVKLKRPEIQRLKELYKIVNNAYANDLKTIKQDVDSAEEKMTEIFLEKALLEQRMDIIIKEIELNLNNQEQRIDLILAEIEQGQYLIAITHFYQLNNTEMFIPLTERTKNNEKLLKFIKTLPSLSDRMIAYKAIFKSGNLGYSIFTLKHDFQIFKTKVPVFKMIQTFSSKNDDFIKFQYELERQVTNKMDQITTLLLTGKPENYSDLVTYIRNQEELFNAHLEELLDRLYESDHPPGVKMNAIFVIARTLTKLLQFAQVIRSLTEFMSLHYNSEDAQLSLKIAYKVKQITLHRHYPRLPEEIKIELEALKERVPQRIKCILWQQVFIRNLELPYTEDHLIRETNSSVGISSAQHQWQFEISDEDYLFKIRHVETNEYLTMGRNVSQNESRKIFTRREPENQYWNWEHLENEYQVDRFPIKLHVFNEYLTVNPDKGDSNHYEASSCVDVNNLFWVENTCNHPYNQWLLFC